MPSYRHWVIVAVLVQISLVMRIEPLASGHDNENLAAHAVEGKQGHGGEQERKVADPSRAGAGSPASTAFASPAAAQPRADREAADVPDSVCLMIEAAGRAHDLPEDFFARVIWQESHFRPETVGPRTQNGESAQGIAQFMPRTAAERGLLDPFDPVQALPKAAHYLRELKEQFGNVGLAAAAYNAGPVRVRRWLAGTRSLPPETRNYVAAVTGVAVEDWKKSGTRPRSMATRPRCGELMALLHEPVHERAVADGPALTARGERAPANKARVASDNRNPGPMSPAAGDPLAPELKRPPSRGHPPEQPAPLQSPESMSARPAQSTQVASTQGAAASLDAPRDAVPPRQVPESADSSYKQSPSAAGPELAGQAVGAQSGLQIATNNPLPARVDELREPLIRHFEAARPADDINPFVASLAARVQRTADSPWGVQLSAGFSRETVLAAYTSVASRYAELLANKDVSVLSSVLRSRGTRSFYQVRVGADTFESATGLCAEIRQAGGACMVLRNPS